jgi:hypothetical protein
MEFILCIGYTLIFIYLIYKLPFFKIDGLSWKLLSGLFVVKILSAIAITLIYIYYYKSRLESDIFKYFDDGRIIFSSLKDNPIDFLRMITGIGADSPHLNHYYDTANFWNKTFDYGLYNDNRTMIRFNAIAMIFSFGYFNVHNVFMAFLSFTGLTAIFKVFYPYLINKRNALIFSVFLVPSVLLWTSGVLKEGILMFAFGLFVYYAWKLSIKKFKWKTFVGILLMIGLLLIIKFYILIAALPGIISIFVIRAFKNKYILPIIVGIHTLIITSFFLFHSIFSSYNLPEIVATKQHDFINMISNTPNVGSKINLPILEPTFISFFKNTPNALFNSFFRPHLFEMHSLMTIPAVLENLFIIFVMILTIIFHNKISLKEFPWFWFCVSFVLILFILCGLTTPVLGALVRYRTPGLPFLFIIFLSFIDLKKIQQFVKWKK